MANNWRSGNATTILQTSWESYHLWQFYVHICSHNYSTFWYFLLNFWEQWSDSSEKFFCKYLMNESKYGKCNFTGRITELFSIFWYFFRNLSGTWNSSLSPALKNSFANISLTRPDMAILLSDSQSHNQSPSFYYVKQPWE